MLSTVNLYRQAPVAETWTVDATVQGPLGPVVMTGVVAAWDEGGAVLAFVERVQGEGFEVVGEASARR